MVSNMQKKIEMGPAAAADDLSQTIMADDGVLERVGKKEEGISPQSCTETDFEMKTSNFVLFLLISVVSVHFRAIYDETIRCQI